MTGDDLNRQYSGPRGEDGRVVMERMNEHHAPLWEWCLAHVPSDVSGPVLDVGCGGGGLLLRLSGMFPDADLFGVDITDDALDMTRSVVGSDRLALHRASVDSMPLDDGSVGLVTAMETYFFWPDLPAALSEIHRVLRDDGVLLLGSEMQVRDDNADRVDRDREAYGVTLFPDAEMARMMADAGFEVSVDSIPENDWVVFTARRGRPGSNPPRP